MLALSAIVSVAAAATPTPTVEIAPGVMYLVTPLSTFLAHHFLFLTGRRYLDGTQTFSLLFVVLKSGRKRKTVLNFALVFDC